MKYGAKISAGIDFLKVKLLSQKIPIAVRMELTNKCLNRCHYCNVWNINSKDPEKDVIFNILKELKEIGTKKISFSGGEPLLRKDIGEIISYTKKLGISPEMNSRGTLIEKKILEIKDLDLLKISLDGPKEVHDFLSNRAGAYDNCIKAIELAKKNNIKVSIATTITKYNLKHLLWLVDLAKNYEIKIALQPLKPLYRGVGVEKMKDLYPDINEYREIIYKLIELKKNGYSKYMRNSLIGLRHIYNWPNYPKLKCSAGRLFIIIDSDGTVYPCDRISYDYKLPNCFDIGIKKSLELLRPVSCSGCGFCGSLELNFLYNFKFGTIKEILWLIK